MENVFGITVVYQCLIGIPMILSQSLVSHSKSMEFKKKTCYFTGIPMKISELYFSFIFVVYNYVCESTLAFTWKKHFKSSSCLPY